MNCWVRVKTAVQDPPLGTGWLRWGAEGGQFVAAWLLKASSEWNRAGGKYLDSFRFYLVREHFNLSNPATSVKENI